MTIQSSAGVLLYIASAPQENLSPEPEWIPVGEITNYGEFGRVYQAIRHDSINEGGTRKLKGQFDDGALTLNLARDPGDVGQAVLIEARDWYGNYPIKIVLNDAPPSPGTPTKFEMLAMVMSYTTNIGGPNQVIGASVSIEIQSGSIIETPASSGA